MADGSALNPTHEVAKPHPFLELRFAHGQPQIASGRAHEEVWLNGLDFVSVDLINPAGKRRREFVHPIFPIFQMEKAHTLNTL